MSVNCREFLGSSQGNPTCLAVVGLSENYRTLRGGKMTVEIALLISIVSVSFSIFFGIKNNKRTDEKDIAERIARDTRTDMKLDEISKDVKDVKETVRNIQNDVKDHEGRIVKLEASLKAEHKRLDDLVHSNKEAHDEQ